MVSYSKLANSFGENHRNHQNTTEEIILFYADIEENLYKHLYPEYISFKTYPIFKIPL
jgi:hypothetical protein